MKKTLLFSLALCCIGASIWLLKDRAIKGAEFELRQSDRAISETRSWRMRLETTSTKLPKEWMVIEAIPPDREHGWQHVDRRAIAGNQERVIKGDLEYLRIGDDRYFRGDAMFGHRAAPQGIKLERRDFPPLDGFFQLRLHLTNPRTIGYSFDSIETTLRSQYYVPEMQMVAVKAHSGHACREWNYDWKFLGSDTGREVRMHDTLCLGITDHLPYHLTTSGGFAEATYEWNPSISIIAPNPVLPRPKGFGITD